MKVTNYLKGFLYDKNYFISLYDNYLHIYKYKDLLVITNMKITIMMDSFTINITGYDLCIIKMTNEELLIKGTVNSVGISYE